MRVSTLQPLDRASAFGALAREAGTRLLVEEDDRVAGRVHMALSAKVEQRIERVPADATLLHANPGVRGERIHRTTSPSA